LGLIGCGGGSNSGSSLAGTYDGTYVTTSASSGFVLLSVDAIGNVTGTITPTGGSATTVAGSINASGQISVYNGTGITTGQLTQRSDGYVGLSLSDTSGNSIYANALVNPVAMAGAIGVYNRNYAGFVINQTGTYEALSFKTDLLGNFNGFVDHFEGNTMVHAAISGTIDTKNAVTISVTNPDGSKDSATGTITVNGKQITGALTSGTGHSMSMQATQFP